MRSSPVDTRGLRVVCGKVDLNAAVQVPGSADWTVTKTTTGTYIVRFIPPFKTLPVIVGSCGGLNVFYLVAVATDYCQINTYQVSTAGTLQDCGFSFHVEGR